MKILKKESGITLVEVLAVVVILALLTILTTNIFRSGLLFSENETKNSLLQQQANYLVSLITKYHENGNPYEVTIDPHKQKIELIAYSDDDSNSIIKSEIINTPQFYYYIYIDGTLIENTAIYPNTEKYFNIEIKITDAPNEKKSYSLKTTISRL